MTPQEFIAMLATPAKQSMQITKIPVSFVIADAALESGWGASGLTLKAMNLFGVKADASWTGDTYTVNTREYEHGQWTMVLAKFRKYTTWEDSINDHARFLMENPRYAACFDHSDGPGFATAVAAAGYATDPSYAEKIIAIIKSNDLQALDISLTPTVSPELHGLIVTPPPAMPV